MAALVVEAHEHAYDKHYQQTHRHYHGVELHRRTLKHVCAGLKLAVLTRVLLQVKVNVAVVVAVLLVVYRRIHH